MPKNRRSRGQRRSPSEGMAAPARVGAQRHKSLAKSLSPQGQQVAQEARQAAASGDHTGAAERYKQLGEHLATEGKAPLAARAYLRAARALHQAGRADGRDKALGLAIQQAKAAGNSKAVLTHFRDLVRRVRSKGDDELADHLRGVIQEGLGKSKLGRENGEGQPRTGGGRGRARRRRA